MNEISNGTFLVNVTSFAVIRNLARNQIRDKNGKSTDT